MKKNKILLEILFFVIGLGICITLQATGIISSAKLLIVEYIGIYIIAVMGINIINGYLGIFAMSHAGIMAVGSYMAGLAGIYFFSSQSTFPLAILAGGLAATVIGMLIALSSFKVSGDYLAIITLGFTLIIKNIFQNWQFVGGANGLKPIPHNTTLVWVFIFVAFTFICMKRFVNSKYGRVLKAMRADSVASELMSVNLKKVKLVAFAFSSFFIGIAGGLLAHLLSYTNANSFGYSMIVDGMIMVYLGGIGSLTGSIVGATIWQILVNALRSIGTYRWILGGIILILVMIFMPKGLFGDKELTWESIKEFFARLKAGKKKKTAIDAPHEEDE